MLIVPYLPAPAAFQDPSNGHAARIGGSAPQRVLEQAPVGADANSRLRRTPPRPDWVDPAERASDGRRHRSHAFVHPQALSGRGATSLFFVQSYAQEEAPAERPATPHESGAAAYPSLAFDDDILLPGEAVPFDWNAAPRLDIVV